MKLMLLSTGIEGVYIKSYCVLSLINIQVLYELSIYPPWD